MIASYEGTFCCWPSTVVCPGIGRSQNERALLIALCKGSLLYKPVKNIFPCICLSPPLLSLEMMRRLCRRVISEDVPAIWLLWNSTNPYKTYVYGICICHICEHLNITYTWWKQIIWNSMKRYKNDKQLYQNVSKINVVSYVRQSLWLVTGGHPGLVSKHRKHVGK